MAKFSTVQRYTDIISITAVRCAGTLIKQIALLSRLSRVGIQINITVLVYGGNDKCCLSYNNKYTHSYIFIFSLNIQNAIGINENFDSYGICYGNTDLIKKYNYN